MSVITLGVFFFYHLCFQGILPPGVPADLQSAVKKCSTTLSLGICNPHLLFVFILACCGFQIRRSSIGYDLFLRRISNPPGAWRG